MDIQRKRYGLFGETEQENVGCHLIESTGDQRLNFL